MSAEKMSKQKPDRRETDRKNDTLFLTPLLLMALVIAGGLLVWAMLGPPPPLI